MRAGEFTAECLFHTLKVDLIYSEYTEVRKGLTRNHNRRKNHPTQFSSGQSNRKRKRKKLKKLQRLKPLNKQIKRKTKQKVFSQQQKLK